jgi:hypothetical protein
MIDQLVLLADEPGGLPDVILNVFGLLLLVGGFAVLYVRVNRKCERFLRTAQTLNGWRPLLHQGVSQAPVIPAHELGQSGDAGVSDELRMTIRVPAIRNDYWWPGQSGQAAASLVPVPLDYLARLGYPDAWHKGRQWLDATAFTLCEAEVGQAGSGDLFVDADLLARGGRGQLYFGPEDRLATDDEYEVRAHVAVHFRVAIPLERAPELERLFAERQNFLRLLRKTVEDCLRQELKQRKYREALYDVPAIVARLNRAWFETGGQRDILEVTVTALLIMARQEAERNFLRPLYDSLNRALITGRNLADQLKATVEQLNGKWKQITEDIRFHLDTLRRLPGGLMETADNLGAVAQNETSVLTAVLNGCEVLYENSSQNLQIHAQGLAESFRSLSGFSQQLFEERRKYARGDDAHPPDQPRREG